jgi:hypothetical protein
VTIGKFQFPIHGRNDFIGAKRGRMLAADFSPTSVVRFREFLALFLEPSG